jgi:Tol biopolymer transport system component
MHMPKVWPSLLAGWFAALTANGCSVDQRSLGTLAAPQGEAGTPTDVFVEVLADGPVDASVDRPVDASVDRPVDKPIDRQVDRPVDRQVDGPVDRQVDGPVDRPADGPVDGPVDRPVDGLTDSQDALEGEAGPGAETWVPFGPLSPHPAFTNLGASQADPTLTADELELYFSSNPNGDYDIWLVKRTGTASWGTPAKVDELSSTSLDETPEVSADGLTIYLASDRPGGKFAGEHLWVSHRATRTAGWDPPTQVTELAGVDRSAEISPSLQKDQLMMVFASQQTGVDNWDLYMTTRQSTADPWGPPTALTTLNTPQYDWDPAVYRGGNSIVFASRHLGGLNSLFHATRGSAAESFSAPQEATEFDVLGNAADPWLSDDGKHIVFDSRQNPSRIYEAFRTPPP